MKDQWLLHLRNTQYKWNLQETQQRTGKFTPQPILANVPAFHNTTNLGQCAPHFIQSDNAEISLHCGNAHKWTIHFRFIATLKFLGLWIFTFSDETDTINAFPPIDSVQIIILWPFPHNAQLIKFSSFWSIPFIFFSERSRSNFLIAAIKAQRKVSSKKQVPQGVKQIGVMTER